MKHDTKHEEITPIVANTWAMQRVQQEFSSFASCHIFLFLEDEEMPKTGKKLQNIAIMPNDRL